MENKNYFVAQTILENNSKNPLIIKSPDFPEIHNQYLPVGYSSIMQFRYPTDLKLRQNSWVNQEGNTVIYLTLVDKDF